jgi:hypothetical protein
MKVLITGHGTKNALRTVLSSSSIGQHTGIVHLRPTTSGVEAEQFEWIHHTNRPNGRRLPIQCPKCYSIRSWVVPEKKPKKYNKTQVFLCGTKGCPGICEIRRLKGYRPSPIESNTGAWYSKAL